MRRVAALALLVLGQWLVAFLAAGTIMARGALRA
jgi:hypothetical protein